MMSTSVDLLFNIIGKDHASKALNTAGKSAKNLDRDLKGSTKALHGLRTAGAAIGGSLAALGLAAAGREAVQFAKESVEAFRTVGSESMKMQRLLGGSIEEASLLRGVAKLSGQDIDAFAKSMGLFSKQIVNNGDAFADLGISVTDANGAIRPTQDLLKETADVFASMPSGAEETALAMKLFGKSGADLLPFLNRGSAGIAELEAKTRDLGMTMSQADADGLKKFTAATREMDMAMEGSKATLGKSLMPVMTELKTAAAAIAIPLTQAVTPAFVALGDVAVLAVQSIGENMPAVKAAVADLASGIRGAADAVKDNWPAIKDTIGTVSDAIKRVTDVAKTLWDAFRGLPPEVQQTLATLAVLQKTGAINVAFSGANLAKDLLAKVTGMNVQAAVVNVNGPAGAVPGAAGTAGKTGVAGVASALGINPATLAVGFAAAFAFAVQQVASGSTQRNINDQNGNQSTGAGTYAVMGGGGSNADSVKQWADKMTALTRESQAAKDAIGSLNAQMQAAGTSTDVAQLRVGYYSRALSSAAVAAGLSTSEFDSLSRTIQNMPAGQTFAQVRDSIVATGQASGMTTQEIDRMAAAVVGIPGGATFGYLKTAVEAVGITAGMSGEQLATMSDVIAKIPPGTNADVVSAKLLETGLAAGLTQSQIEALTGAVLGIPTAASTTVTAPGAIQATGEIGGHIAMANAVPGFRGTAVAAPGATGSASQLRDVRSAADQVNGSRSITVTANTYPALEALRGLINTVNASYGSIKISGTAVGATGMSVPGFARGGTPMMVSNGEFYASPQTVARTGGTAMWHALNTGMITGPGTSTSDSIQALGQPGGFVLNARATRRYRPMLRHLADGGPTGAVATMTAPTTTERVALYIDGRMIHESLIRLKRERGGADLGLA